MPGKVHKIGTFSDWVGLFEEWRKEIGVNPREMQEFKFETLYGAIEEKEIQFGHYKGRPKWETVRQIPTQNMRDALLNMAERVPLMDVRFFVTALLVQKETGGNLAELLDELSRLIRERFRIYREVKVRTAQGRLTAAVLIALPFGMLIALEFVNPDYVKVLWTDPIGPMLLGGAAALQVLGSLVIWKIVHIEV